MAKILSNAGIVTGLPVEAEHVSQSVNALTGAEAYDINISGSLTVNTLRYPIVDGTAGQALITDGAGNLTLQHVTTVGTASYVSSSNVYGPFGADSIQTASYAPSSSVADFSKIAETSLFTLDSQNAQTATSASYALTASYLIGERSASYVSSSISENTITFTKSDGSQITNEITSASYALTASYAISASHNITQRVTSSYAETSSYTLTASHALNVDDNAYISSSAIGGVMVFNKINGGVDITPVISSSYAVSSSHSSYAVSASYIKGPIASSSYAERAELTRQISYIASNDDNVTITAGTPLHVVEVTPHNVYKVRRADASNPNRMPAVGVAATTVAPGESTQLIVLGEVKNLDTFGTHVGKNIYVQTGSGFTETPPEFPAIIQPIGIVSSEDFSNGKILINGPMAEVPFALNSTSASYALTASYALNGGGGGGGTYTSTYVTSDTTAEKDRIYVFEESTPYTLTLPLTPSNGDSILISNRSGITTNLIGRNGELIMGIAEDMELNVPPASFMFTYASGTQGWVITGAGSGGGGAITGSGAINTGSFAVTSSNQFKDDQFFTGSLIPEAVGGNGLYDVGSQTHPWRDLYVSTSSLKFVRDAVIIADLNGEDGGVRIGNIFIGTGSISVVSGSGDDMTIIGDVVNTEISGGIITPIAGDTILPTGSISSSAQISALGFITSSQTIDTGSFITTSSLDEYLPTGSISSSAQIEGLGFVTSSSLDEYLPTGSISSSAQLTDLGFITTSSLSEYLPTGSISSSAQIEELGFVTSSSLAEYLPTGSISSSAQLDLKWVLGANGINDYTFNGPGLSGSVNDPLIYLTRGETYRFENNMGAHPFRIQSTPNGSTGTPYNDGITNNDVINGTLIWEVQFDSPDKLYYQCTAHPDMGGEIIISSTSTILPDGVISSSQQLTSLGFVSASASGSTEFSGSTSFVGDTAFSGSTEFSGSVIALKGIRAEGNSVMTGSVIIDGEFTLESNSTATFNTDLEISGSSTQEGNSIITGSLTTTGGITGSLQGTSSVSLDTLLFGGKDSATFATTGSNTFKSSQYITGSVVIAPSSDPGISNLNATYLFTSASNFGEDECDFYYRNKGVLWDQEWLEYGVGSGLIFGGIVTFSGTDLYVSPGGGLVVNYNAETGSANAVSPTQVKWGPITSSATFLTSSQYSHIFIDENGDLQQQVEDFTTQQYLEKIPLGTLGHLTNAYIDAFGEEKQTTYAGPAQANQFIRAFGPLKQQGYDLSATTSTLEFNASSGITYKLGGFYSKDPNNPSVYDTPALNSTGKVVRVYQSGSEFIGDINAGNFYDTIDPTKYDDGSGTLVNISGSTTTIQRVFIGPTSERFYVYYGQDTYDSVATALQNLTTEAFTESLTTSKSLTFIGYLVVQANTTDLSNESSANIINAGLFRNTAGSSGGGTSTISNLGDITDVDIAGPVTGEYLKYNAGVWENSHIQYSEVNNTPSGIISSSIQLESLGVSVSSGSNTTFGNNVVISGSNSTLEVQGDLHVTGSLSTKTQVANPSFTPLGWALTIPVSTGNFFETTLAPTVNTIGFGLTGGYTGQTINLKVIQPSLNPGTITWGSNVEFPDGFDSAASTGVGDIDIWSFVTFDGNTWYGTGLKNFS